MPFSSRIEQGSMRSLVLVTDDADLDHLAEGVFFRCLHRKYSFPPFPCCTFWEESHYKELMRMEWEVRLLLLEGEVST